MRKKLLVVLAASSMLFGGPAAAAKLDPGLHDALLKTAAVYAGDRSLIFYCLRKSERTTSVLYAGIHLDLAYTLQIMTTAGAEPLQRAQLIEAVWRNVRPARPEEDDPRLNANCATADVEKSLEQLKGVGTPLFMRSPFEKLRP